VGLEPTSSALRERYPARRVSPAYSSSQCWCRANSTEVQSLGPLPRAWPEKKSDRVGSRLRSGTATVTGSHAEATTPYPPQLLIEQYPRQESNLIYDLRKVACEPAHSEDILPANQSEIRESNPVVSCSQGRRLPISPISAKKQYPGQESNLGLDLRRVARCPFHHQGDSEAGDRGGNRTLVCRVQADRLPVRRHAHSTKQ
jgi:hypothetical protein